MSLEQTITDLTAAVKAQTEILGKVNTTLAILCAKTGGDLTAPVPAEPAAQEAPAPKAKATKAKAAPEPEVEPEVAEEQIPPPEELPAKDPRLVQAIINKGLIQLKDWRKLTRRQKHSLVVKPSEEIDPNNPPPSIELPEGERNDAYYEEHVKPVLFAMAKYVAPDGKPVGGDALRKWLSSYQTMNAKNVPTEKWDELVNFAECQLLTFQLEYEGSDEEVEV